jgi:hypothetical protein
MPSWSLRTFRQGFRESLAGPNEGNICEFHPGHRSVHRVVFRGGPPVGSLVARIGLDEADSIVPYENGSLRLNELEGSLAASEIRAIFDRVSDSDLLHGLWRQLGCMHRNGNRRCLRRITASTLRRIKLSLTQDCRFVNLRVFEEISAIFRFPGNRLNRLYLSPQEISLLRNLFGFAGERSGKFPANIPIS